MAAIKIELCGSKEEVNLRIKDEVKDFFALEKTLRPPLNSDKFVKLFTLLKKHGWASKERHEIIKILAGGK